MAQMQKDRVKKLAPVERKARWQEVKLRYPHMTFTEQLEPAHQVIDKFHGMKADGELKYMAPHEIPTRDQELRNVKTEEMIKRDASATFEPTMNRRSLRPMSGQTCV